jgi:hypothetical protein
LRTLAKGLMINLCSAKNSSARSRRFEGLVNRRDVVEFHRFDAVRYVTSVSLYGATGDLQSIVSGSPEVTVVVDQGRK